ncbi:hypothetical protein FACS1894201_11340 [Bacteroidia bacterium]|nr:hypothetical protein FACS1894201_11340 [Bacteroidia bacterium]
MILNRDVAFTENRHDFDIIEGPVADDKVQRHINKYLVGDITREEFFKQIVHFEQSHQICFCTLNSLRMLKKDKEKNGLSYNIKNIGEPLVEQLMLDLNIDEVKAADMFYSSATFTQLVNPDTKLYEKEWQEIYQMLMMDNYAEFFKHTDNTD